MIEPPLPVVDVADEMTPDELDRLLGDALPLPSHDPGLVITVGSHDTAALYVDGALVLGGDHYSVFMRAIEAAGMTLIESDGFLLGHEPDAATVPLHAAPTLQIVRQYEETMHRTKALRLQAVTLLDRAIELEQGLMREIGAALPAERPSDTPVTETNQDQDDTAEVDA